MRILMTTPYFSPSLGGMETVAESLASEFVAMGHEVVVATSTHEDDGAVRPFRILRAPSALSLVRESLRAFAIVATTHRYFPSHVDTTQRARCAVGQS